MCHHSHLGYPKCLIPKEWLAAAECCSPGGGAHELVLEVIPGEEPGHQGEPQTRSLELDWWTTRARSPEVYSEKELTSGEDPKWRSTQFFINLRLSELL